MAVIYVKKVYPIKGRKDFFKYVVIDHGKIAKGWQGNNPNTEMYFQDKSDADRVATAIKKVQALNKKLATSKNEAGKNGTTIQCPYCKSKHKVYHFNWSSLTCKKCKKDVKRSQWIIVK